MSVLIDTCVWSLALRRQATSRAIPAVAVLIRLIHDGNASLIGPIRQELLSGVRNGDQFARLREHMSAFLDLPLETDVFERAASYFNHARSKGLQGSNTDFLICAVATSRDMPLLTVDHDFKRFATLFGLKLVLS